MAGDGEFSMVQPSGEVLVGRVARYRVQFTLWSRSAEREQAQIRVTRHWLPRTQEIAVSVALSLHVYETISTGQVYFRHQE